MVLKHSHLDFGKKKVSRKCVPWRQTEPGSTLVLLTEKFYKPVHFACKFLIHRQEIDHYLTNVIEFEIIACASVYNMMIIPLFLWYKLFDKQMLNFSMLSL